MVVGFRTSGMFGRKPMQTEMPAVMPQPGAMPIGVKEMTKKPGFFQKGGFGQYALAALSDFGASLNDRDQNMLGDMMAFQQRNQMLAEKARLDAIQSQQQRMQKREDLQWEWQNKPKDSDPKDQLTRYMIAAGIDPNSPRARELYARAVENEVDPVQAVPFTDAQGNSGFQYVRPSQMQGGGAAPTSKAEYDALPPGAQYRAPDGSIRTKGGSGGNVTGGFQRP